MEIEDMIEQIHWLGHDAFCIEGDNRIYIDPFEIAEAPAADIILITHEHYDHCSPDDVAKLSTPKTVIITEKDSAAKLTGDVRVVAPGDRVSVGAVSVEAVAAYNVDKTFHPRAKGWLGFIVELDGVRIYHAGDTDLIPEMSAYKVDIALLPVSGTYVMTAEEAVQAALVLKPEVAIPMHYGAIVGGPNDAERFEKALENRIPVRILK
jgi:L-ascorbate metabolism protein UlaG (beta-lactamase superfamily)